MRRMAGAVLLWLALWASAGSGVAGDGELHVLAWADTFDSQAVHLFEVENECRVNLVYFEDYEELYTALQQGNDYDVAVPSSYLAAQLWREELILPIDKTLLPNLHHLDPGTIADSEDPEHRYSVAIILSVVGWALRGDSVRRAATAAGLADPGLRQPDSISLLPDMRETFGLALRALGHSANTRDDDQIAEAAALIASWRRNTAFVEVDEALSQLVVGKLSCAHSYNGDVAMWRMEDAALRFVLPKEGGLLAADDFVIPSRTPSPELAHKFINHMLDPAIAKMTMENVRDYIPNASALKLLDGDLREDPIFTMPKTRRDDCEMLRDIGSAEEVQAKYWAELMESSR